MPVVKSLAELYSFSSSELAEQRPVELDVRVLCFDREWNQLFLQADTKPFYLKPEPAWGPLKCGDLLRINALTSARTDGFPLTNVHVMVIGHSNPPPARAIGLTELKSTTGDWVELMAIARSAETSRGRLLLNLKDRSEQCVAYVMGPVATNDCKAWINALVRLRGINTSHIVQGRVTELSLMVPDIAQVALIQAAQPPAWELPVVSIDALLNREVGEWTNEPVHLNGVATAYSPGESLLLKDPTGIIQARISQSNGVREGDRLDVWGYLDPGGESTVHAAGTATQPRLADAYFEVIRPAPALQPPPAEASEEQHTEQIISNDNPTNIAQLRSLNPRDIRRGLAVSLPGTVVYSDPDWHTSFVHDGRTGIYAESSQSNIVAGARVVVRGRAALGSFGPTVVPAQFEVIGHTNLPPAMAADLADLADGSFDCQWIQMRGVVRRAAIDSGHLRLTVMTHLGRFNVLVPRIAGAQPPAGLLDSRILVEGVCGSDVNSRYQVSGITLYSPGLEQIHIIEPAPRDPFAGPATAMAAIASFDPERVAGRRVKVAGIVILNLAGTGLYLQDQSGGIRVQAQSPDAAAFQPGDFVEVLGFPALGDFSPHLEEPIIRRLRSESLPEPRRATAEEILIRGTNDATRITLDAELLQRIPRGAQPKLVLQQGSIIFSAQLTGGNVSEAMRQWRPGSILRLTGVCSIQGGEDHAPQSFRLLVPPGGEVSLLTAPPLLTRRHFVITAATLIGLGLMALAWIQVLRRQIRSRTAALSASQATLQTQFEHTQALAELGRLLNAARSPKEAARIIVEVADRLIGWDSCICAMYSAETKILSTVLMMDLMDGRRAECTPPVDDPAHKSPLAYRTIQSGPQLILRKPGQQDCLQSVKFGDKNRRSASSLFVPIHKGEEVVGLVSIQSYTVDAYDQRDLETLQALADHCSGALDRIRVQQQLVDISRQTGMAEVAAAVLHNVGNVLNSINVSVAMLRDTSRASDAGYLSKVCDLFKAHAADLGGFLAYDPKGRKIPGFLGELAGSISAKETQSRAELDSLSSNIEHIKQIVATHQSYARVAGVAETVAATELTDEAIRMNSSGLSTRSIEICRNYPAHAPFLTVDKHKVLQILINLIRNAQHACEDSGRADKKLTVSIANGGNRIRISVEDNGVGIPPENMKRIFNFGFSTRRNGNGVGLHSGALAAKEMGGELTVHSDGPRTGATFTLDLPLKLN